MKNISAKGTILDDEEARLATVLSYGITEETSIDTFKDIASMAAHLFRVPIASLSIVQKDQVYFKASCGLENLSSVERSQSLCTRAIQNPHGLVYENLSREPDLQHNPFIKGEDGLRFYAAAPLLAPNGHHIGVLCIANRKPRKFGPSDYKILQHFACLVMDELEIAKEMQVVA